MPVKTKTGAWGSSTFVETIPKKTRHVALRYAKVLPESDRIWFCPTNDQRADGLTKSCNPTALRHIFINDPKPVAINEDEDEEEGVCDFAEFYFARFNSGF